MALPKASFGSKSQRFGAGVGGRLPGATRAGSFASWRKTSGQSMRKDMSDIIANYEALIKALDGITPTALRDALMPAFNRSQVYVPKATGALADSGTLDVAPNEDGLTMGTIEYGNSEAPYAAIVHEMVYNHHAAPTRAKYLQSALEEEMDSFLVSAAVDYAQVFE